MFSFTSATIQVTFETGDLAAVLTLIDIDQIKT